MPEPIEAKDKKEPKEKPLPMQKQQTRHASDSIDAVENIEKTLRQEYIDRKLLNDVLVHL